MKPSQSCMEQLSVISPQRTKSRAACGAWLFACSLAALLVTGTGSASVAASETLSLVVMDPLAAPLSCPCVEGYAQRRYEELAEYLERELNRPVRLSFAESLKTALAGDAAGRADLIIGKDSVVRSDARHAKLRIAPIASLTGKDGLTTQTGLMVVPTNDPAKRIEDLADYRIFFGPAECEEKCGAVIARLRAAGITCPEPRETSVSCSDGAAKTLELGPNIRAAAVISSYAKPLLEGCGTIKQGDLRVIGETQPVPFITAFLNVDVAPGERKRITDLLLLLGTRPELCTALETTVGFLPSAPAAEIADVKKK